MNIQYIHPADQLVMFMQRIYDKGLTTMSGGNLSIRDSEGNIALDASGNVMRQTLSNPKYCGSVLPKGNIGFSNDFTWKGLNLGFLVTARLGGIVLSRLIKTGGLKFDEAVRQTVRREFNLLIGQKTAATIRQSIGDLEKEGKGAVVYGRDIVVGLPVEREIPTDLINSCLEEHFNTIIVIFFRFFLTTGLIYPSLQ